MTEENSTKVPWRIFHDEMMAVQHELMEQDKARLERDKEHMAALLQIQNSLSDIHTRFGTMLLDIAELKRNAIPWRNAVWLVNRKSITALVVTLASVAGWGWLRQIADLWLK